ncbi:tRNA adenosine(34) deaminase TadA [Variovorax sp. J22R133]|uniref:tRNA adenosine(34) deaminase TadA n=1 Tax=Variovorax brevis TaxID=3053503 RepID=UPI0025763288|nr:tRNA adenosine(34) deaminase TadA [Variovorax sp. J22R133]MDM0110596.1 tRNA adenosine(34) deaminase TadA [Variovorax sp. J22R133]
MTDDAHWMALALSQARAAREAGEVPVGAVVVKDGAVVAVGRNAPVWQRDPTAHAEINALRAAAAALGNYRLDGCELFVTLEPCAMCAGAMLHARLARVVFGAADPKTGAAGSVVDLFASAQLNHQTVVQGGVMEESCAEELQAFFRDRREQARAQAQPLRDDALRTPESRFDGLAGDMGAHVYISYLPRLNGWRMHYMDRGDGGETACLCLHGAGDWNFAHRHVVDALAQAGCARVLAPDLIGFGRSDKPKRESVHTLEWHRDVLLEWVDRLALKKVVLVTSSSMQALADALVNAAPAIFAAAIPATGERKKTLDDAWRAPFPDRGFEAALRAFGGRGKARDIPPGEAQAIARAAMGYLAA